MLHYILKYVQFVNNLFKMAPKMIRSDQSGQYQNEALKRFYCSEGISQQFTIAYTPQQNEVAERKHCSRGEMARCMILNAQLPQQVLGRSCEYSHIFAEPSAYEAHIANTV